MAGCDGTGSPTGVHSRNGPRNGNASISPIGSWQSTPTFNYKDPKNAVIIDGHHSIGYLKGTVTSRVLEILEKNGFYTLYDLKARSPEGLERIAQNTIITINDVLITGYNGRYNPDWKPSKFKKSSKKS